MKEQWMLGKYIQSRRDRKIIEHTLRHESLLKTLIKGDVEGHIVRGRLRAEYMTQIMKDINKEKYKDLKELSYNRKAWKTATN